MSGLVGDTETGLRSGYLRMIGVTSGMGLISDNIINWRKTNRMEIIIKGKYDGD